MKTFDWKKKGPEKCSGLR